MRRLLRSTRVCVVLLIVSVLWALCGGPIFPQEFAVLPDRFLRMLRQTPMRMLAVLQQWFA